MKLEFVLNMGCSSSPIHDLVLQLLAMASRDCQMPLTHEQQAVGPVLNISPDDIMLHRRGFCQAVGCRLYSIGHSNALPT
jgi:hypothetical protein